MELRIAAAAAGATAPPPPPPLSCRRARLGADPARRRGRVWGVVAGGEGRGDLREVGGVGRGE